MPFLQPQPQPTPRVSAQVAAKSQEMVWKGHVSDLGDERSGSLAARVAGPGPGSALDLERLARIVELMWKLRYTDARRHVREETPFFTGPRVGVEELINKLP